ncbi:unnamed protein product [Aureobasidium uvarum]|uniref:Glycosyltransferase family 31 protein n=1 Tax=Aureobasidium uvarum TaxID=2773716 RepID=A0A9N8KEH4_9PEZI|nr:unnamed protein product [Aureobasidium uvarum]
MVVKRLRFRLLVAVVCFTGFTLWNSSSLGNLLEIRSAPQIQPGEPDLSCRNLPGANDTLVVLKTGSTEIQDRLPIHFSTTLRCYPNYMIFSDHEEDYEDQHIFDALSGVSPELVDHHKDFELYRNLKQDGRAVLKSSDLSGSGTEATQWHGKVENPGWKLDKWKFLPMLNRTLHEYPDKKWYVFVEADSYLLWASLLEYLAVLDPSKPHYTGSIMFIGDTVFAHGGSGFMVSQPAMHMVVDQYAAHKAEIEAYTDGHWAGDCVLGKVFTEAGVKFTDAWPIMQGDYPGLVAYARPDGRPIADPNKRVWCYPTVSYHHVSPEMIEDLWKYEQQWLAHKPQDVRFHRHKDIFSQYILPRMSTDLLDWDNESDREESNIGSFEECRSKCEAASECKQYSYSEDGHCKTRVDPRLGKATPHMKSGWLPDRMERFKQDMAPCGDESWML